jgi:hypothetical protein
MGEACALCKEAFQPGAEIVICPDDATRHHAQCWELNGNHCTAYGCEGQGAIATEEFIERRQPVRSRDGEPGSPRRIVYRTPDGRSKVQVMPSRSFSCAQGCFLLMMGAAILLLALGCFGMWAIFDFVMIEVFDWNYREPLTQLQTVASIWLPLLY